jgi:nucleotide-binding universal stress UspA family protein
MNNGAVIVVGVDGSDRADRALDWAIDEAFIREATVRVVTAWHVPLVVQAKAGAIPPANNPLEDTIRQAAEAIATAAAARVRDAGNTPVETAVVEGDAADILIDRARDAQLLVVGSPGHKTVSGNLLTGSVGLQCALHAAVPTTVVH